MNDSSPKIALADTETYDGEYEWDPDREFTANEWAWIKKHAGYYPATYNDGIANQDAHLLVAIACIALVRDGKIVKDEVGSAFEQIAEKAPLTSIRLILPTPQEEDDVVPPAEPAQPATD